LKFDFFYLILGNLLKNIKNHLFEAFRGFFSEKNMSEEKAKKSRKKYGASNIRYSKSGSGSKKTAMYIGDIVIKGLHHLIWEVVDNSID